MIERRARALLVLFAVTAGCNQASPGTSVRIALAYPGDLALDTVDVTLGSTTKSTSISHELLLLVPDDLDGQNLPLEVWGRSNDQRAAHGVTSVMPVRDQTVAAALELTACAPRCEGDLLMGCGAPVTCRQGCSADGEAHCIRATPSNGIDPALVDPVTGATTIAMDATFDTDTGAIREGLTRAPLKGLDAGIGYYQAEAIGAGGVPLGIFVFHDLTVADLVTVRFIGARGAVLLVGGTATIDGTIEVSGGVGAQPSPGPGGGAGATDTRPAAGCGPGGPGGRAGSDDGGGGGGGGSQPGGEGGRDAVHGAGGPSCLPPLLEPLAGGSGGGRGGLGTSATSAGGGGGGGALQLTAFGGIDITGTINAGGAGGEAGAQTTIDAGGGGGGGAGGGILLEAPTVFMLGSATVAANGGGGGGGGGDSLTDKPAAGSNGTPSTEVASGGSGGEPLGNGGTGGGPTPADFGSNGVTNGGGGGGGGGVIVIRGTSITVMGRTSPFFNRAELHPPR
jgi:hypothetical protein